MGIYTEEQYDAALQRLMIQYGDGIKRMCCIYLHDLSAAEDAAQDTFIKAYDHLEDLLSGAVVNEKAWLLRIAINTCKDVLRSSWFRHIDKRRSIEILPLFTTPHHEDRMDLTRAIMGLSPKYREIVLLHYYQDVPLQTCAQILGISPSTASRRLQQAQKKLRVDLEGG